ncbi:MAG TPA: MAPEG family protein [Rhizorhapis sp.]
MLLPITLTFAATAALLNLLLAIRVSRLRVAYKILHGDGGNVALARRMRAHANYIEYTPFILILAGLVELARGSEAWLWIVALVYIVGRALHAFGMDKDFPSKLRQFGVLVTWATLLILAGVALYSAYQSPDRELPPAAGIHV